jgi:pyruvate/2-oxoglutarate dehydrogenase complex dihydrolipoamide acyltransferase (E2) component
VPVQKPVQVQGSTSKEYGEDVGGEVSRKWESGGQEKRRQQATYSQARHCWGHSCECGHMSSTKPVRQLAAENNVSPSTAWRILGTDLRMHPYMIHVFQSLTTVCREKLTRFEEEFGDHLQENPHTLEHIWVSDEANFNLVGDINRQNVNFWCTQHPHQIH